MEFVIIKNAKTGHEQRIQKSDWDGYSNLYVGYHLATDDELEQFEKVEEAPQGNIIAPEDNQAETEETSQEGAGESSTEDNSDDLPKAKRPKKKKDTENN